MELYFPKKGVDHVNTKKWYAVDLYNKSHDGTKIYEWCDKHGSTSRYFVAFQHRWYFENDQDAMLFTLRWM